MEKIYLKPTAQEISLKGGTVDGYTDAFAYAPDTAGSRALGHLFVVGNVSHETDDMAYVVNLISALAKREYYAKPSTTPREAFTATLKKINEVVEEFFKNKGLSINIGVFAIAGEQMLISKLGKFKVLLARNDRTVDVLNNIELFSKEHVQEKQFSNIISGQVSADDRIFAFYPTRATATRERLLKDSLLKLSSDSFIEKLNAIKAEKASFGCGGLHIALAQIKETAVAPKIQPEELAAQETVVARPASASRTTKRAAALAVSTPQPKPVLPTSPTPAEPPAPVSVPDSPSPAEYDEMPRIIASEFALGKKHNPLLTFIHRMRINNLHIKYKALLAGLLTLTIVGGAFVAKSIFWVSPETKTVNAAVSNAENALQLARAKLAQNDRTSARAILVASLETLTGLTADKVADVRTQLTGALDTVDQAQTVVPTLIYAIPADQGQASMIAAIKGTTYAYVADAQGKGHVLAIAQSGNSTIDPASQDFKPNAMFSTDESFALIDTNSGHIGIPKNNRLAVSSVTVPANIGAFSLYADNLYFLTDTTIQKIADASKGGSQATAWLKKGTLPANPALMAVEGNIYVLSQSGTLAAYFRGEKISETETSLTVSPGQILLAASDSPTLALVDRAMRRMYLIDKKLGTVVKTLKIDTEQTIVSAAVSPDGTISFLTSDNKIWKAQ